MGAFSEAHDHYDVKRLLSATTSLLDLGFL
jgi:hypothetical protein